MSEPPSLRVPIRTRKWWREWDSWEYGQGGHEELQRLYPAYAEEWCLWWLAYLQKADIEDAIIIFLEQWLRQTGVQQYAPLYGSIRPKLGHPLLHIEVPGLVMSYHGHPRSTDRGSLWRFQQPEWPIHLSDYVAGPRYVPSSSGNGYAESPGMQAFQRNGYNLNFITYKRPHSEYYWHQLAPAHDDRAEGMPSSKDNVEWKVRCVYSNQPKGAGWEVKVRFTLPKDSFVRPGGPEAATFFPQARGQSAEVMRR
ncbi:hypothetical protein JCM5296_005188 [Sporobolomyces johnsonii]